MNARIDEIGVKMEKLRIKHGSKDLFMMVLNLKGL
jgi:hypothetical protein